MWDSPDDCLDNQILDILPHLGRVDSLSLHVVPQSLQTPANTEIITCMHWNHRAPYPSTNTELICIYWNHRAFSSLQRQIFVHLLILNLISLYHSLISLYMCVSWGKKHVWECIFIKGAHFKMAFCCKVKF